MKKFIQDTLLMLLGALITMLIIGLGELPTLSFETLIQLSLAVGLGFFIRFLVNKKRKPKLVLNKLDSICEWGGMSKYVVWFEDTTKDLERANNGSPSLGLPIEFLPPKLKIYGKQFYDKSCNHLSCVLVDYDAAIKLREVAEMNGTIAWVRECTESNWQRKKTICGRQAYTPSSDC